MTILVRNAQREELETVWKRVESAVDFMAKQGNPQWNADYPRREHFAKALEEETLFVAEADGAVAGAVILDESQASEYGTLTWNTPERSLVIHKLALGQEFMGRGVAGAIFAFAEEEARRRGLRGLRVDTYHKNRVMRRRLERQGFSFVGAIRFPTQQPGEYFCYEKPV